MIITLDISLMGAIIGKPENYQSTERNKKGMLQMRDGNHYFHPSRKFINKLIHSRYVFIKQLGEGSSACVSLVVHRETSTRYACKTVFIGHINTIETMRTEMAIAKTIRHDNIIKSHEIYETPDALWMINELAECSLDEYLSRKILSISTKAQFMKQLLHTVIFLHENGIVHCDLKMENILVSVRIISEPVLSAH